MSTYSQLSWLDRRAVCTGESLNMIRRLNVPPTAPLVAAAASVEQCHFEANFLLSWVEAASSAFSRRGRSMPSFVSATHPAPDSLAISVSDPALLLPLLDQLLPRCVNGILIGTPGLRVYLWRDFMEFRMLAAENDVRARIRLYGVNQSRKQGKELLARLAQSWPACRPLYLDRALTPAEMECVRTPAMRQEAVLSGILRRFSLWRTADQVSVNLTEDAVSVRWHSSPSEAEVVAVLGSPSCGIPHMAYGASTVYNVYEITLSNDSEFPHHGREPWERWNAVHAVQQADRNRVAVAPRRRTLVPPEAWEPEEMRNALAARDIRTVYKLLRRRGVSQRQIVAMTGLSQSEVSEVLKGRQVNAYDVLIRIVHGLGIPRGYMNLAPDVLEPENAEKRRRFLAHAAAVAVGAHVLGADSGSWASNRVVTPAPDRVGMTDVRQVEAATRALRSMAYKYGGGFCRDAAAAQSQWVIDLLANADDVEIRRRLAATIADLEAIGNDQSQPGDPLSGHGERGEDHDRR